MKTFILVLLAVFTVGCSHSSNEDNPWESEEQLDLLKIKERFGADFECQSTFHHISQYDYDLEGIDYTCSHKLEDGTFQLVDVYCDLAECNITNIQSVKHHK